MFPSMQRSLWFALPLALLPLFAVSAPLAQGALMTRAGADAGKPEPPVPPCVKLESKAIFSGSGYDHVVSIDNGCQQDVDCSVSTDVSDETLSVMVPAGESRDLVTYRGSPASEFKASVKCTLKK